jgi:enediyne polyketide synthase
LVPQSTLSVVVQYGVGVERKQRRDKAIQRALGETVAVVKRPDGKPEVAGAGANTEGQVVSVSHSADISLVVTGQCQVGCDIEPVVARDASTWQDLLGTERFGLARLIARDNAEPEDVATTRVWAANECLKKAGAAVGVPLVLEAVSADGWVLLSSGSLAVATFAAQVEGAVEPLVMALLTCAKGVEDHALL